MRQIKFERRKSVSFSDSDAGRSRIVHSHTNREQTGLIWVFAVLSRCSFRQPEGTKERERAVNSSSARSLAVSAQLQVQTSQIGFNLFCFANYRPAELRGKRE